jgi:signal transduction histidine kinase/DNA-binding response OmpR family regulator/CHASE3 domain sensor protein
MSATPLQDADRSADPFPRRSSALLPLGTLLGLVVAGVAAVLIALVSVQSSESRSATVRQFTGTLELVQQLQQLLSLLKDAETGQRGYLLTGEAAYLAPYNDAHAAFDTQLQALRALTGPEGSQAQRIARLAEIASAKFAELDRTIALKRDGRGDEALALVRTDQGKALMDRFRAVAGELEREGRARFEASRGEWESVARSQAYVTWGGAALLLFLIVAAGAMASRDYRGRERIAWIRTGESLLATRIQGDKRLEALGEEVLRFLAGYLDAKVGAAYVRTGDGRYRRVAGYALEAATAAETVRPGEGLLGEAAKQGRAIRVADVPEGYLPVASAVGRAAARELLVVPALIDGEVQGVIEVGLLRRTDDADRELLDRVSTTLAVAIRSARERERREELLEETQRQAEELQAQQEELRVSNEELEEQGRVLRESQTRLENQHAELEQTNVQLEEQAERLERQRQELLHSQEALTENAAMLERTSRYKSEFLANMSHELRTPLNSSLILAKLLADNARGNLDDEQVRFAHTILSSNNDLLTLINDILDLSKIEAGQVDIQPEPFGLEEMLHSLRDTFAPIAADKQVMFHLERAGDAPPTLVTDRQRVQQILKNLLSNAFKFTAAGEVVLKVSAVAGGRVAFAVRDTGIGIPEQQRGVIFEAFRQADGTTSRQYGGTGLGLSISRELARLLEGQIRLQSAPGQGSTFTLEIPAAIQKRAVAEAAPRPAPSPAQPAGTSPPNVPAKSAAPATSGPHIDDDRARRQHRDRLILVVEDDQRFARVLYDLAHELSFDCVHCSTAGEAHELAKRLKPSGILLDVRLSDDSGLALLERIKRDPAVRHIPVHMVSVEDHVQAALGMGAVGYALKPVAREELVKAIGKLEERLRKRVSRVLVVEDDATLRGNIALLLQGDAVEITTVGTVAEALRQVEAQSFDCLVTDLALPDASGYDLLEKLSEGGRHSFLPVIVYTGRALSRDEETRLHRYSKSIIIKGARSPERLLDEVTLFLHRVESTLPQEKQNILRRVRQRDAAFEGRTILIAEDDVRNIFALTRVLEPLGAEVAIARNGQEAVDQVGKGGVDLVLMDIMMPVKDGLQAIREIRGRRESMQLPIIAITAKAMADDRRQCLEAGANDYIAKPIDIDRLVSLCRVWMPK